MEIDLALLADAATVDSSGKLSVLGIFDRIAAPRFPARHGRIALVLRFAAGAGDDGRHTVQIRLTAPDGAEIVKIEGKMAVPEGAPVPPLGRRNAQVLNLDGVVFPSPGTYTFEVSVDGTHRLDIPLTLSQMSGSAATDSPPEPAITMIPGARGIPEA